MAWTTGPRGFFASLPPAEKLPEKARSLASRFETFSAEAKRLTKEAEEKERERQRVIADYEAKIGDALLAGKKPPISPIPDWDAAIADLRHRAGGSQRAAAVTFGELGDLLVAQKAESILEAETEVSRAVSEALEAVEKLRPLLDEAETSLSVLYWHQQLRANEAVPYVAGSGEASVIDESYGRIVSVLRRLRHDLDETAARRSEKAEKVPA